MSLHKSASERGGMEPYRHRVVQPLLPYEKRLISALGCSEEEYRHFSAEVQRRSKKRPEAYAHIPDIRNDPSGGLLTSIIVSLVVGAISTAASYLLAPKPKQPDQPAEIRRRQLGSQSGRTIFSPSFGFDTAQELAAYGNVVPIVFTRREDTYETGGLLISPQLVWSRMKSWGGYQVAEIVAVAGQGNTAKPDLAGIFLGNNALDGIYETYFDFYWNGGFEVLGGGSRLRAYNLRYGDLRIDGNNDNPGISGSDQAFYCPTREGANQPGFCGAFSPTSQTRFGVYSGIPNGTPARPDWKVISLLDSGEDEQRDEAATQMRKYVDGYLAVTHRYGGGIDDGTTTAGMPGTGVNYCRRVGVIEHYPVGGGVNTVTHTVEDSRTQANQTLEKWGNLTREVEVNPGDKIVILLGKGKQEAEPFPIVGDHDFPPADLSDIRSLIQGESTRYDQLLSQGSTWMIGRSTWQVIERPNERYDPERHSANGFRITLKCLEGWSRNQRKIGIVDRAAIEQEKYLPFSDIEESYYPILKYEIGTFQNTRACDVTEIGIKSQVWTRFNGITNFNTLKSPGIMARLNDKDIQVTGGKMTTYAHRMSLFALDVRLSDYDATATDNQGWTNLGPYLFAVVGDSPVDIYSFIRVTHPSHNQFEYRLRPFNSAIPTQQSAGTNTVFVLDGARTPVQDWSFSTYLGDFTLAGRGYFAQPIDYFTHLEMAIVPELITGDDGKVNLVYGGFQPDPSKKNARLVSITANEAGPAYSAGDEIGPNTLSNILSLAAGQDPYFDNLAVGTEKSITWEYSRDAGREVYMKLQLRAVEINYNFTVRNKWWEIVSTSVESINGEWTAGDTFVKFARNKDGTQFAFKYEIVYGSIYQEFDTPQFATRLFQRYSGLAEVSHYGDLISRSCDDSPEHEVIYVNETLSEEDPVDYQGCAMAGLKLKSSDNFTQLDQLRCYLKNGLEVERLLDSDVGASNLLTDLMWYLTTNKDTGVGSIVHSGLIDRDALIVTAKYLRANQLFWDDVIAEPINLRSWLAAQAPSVLCFTSMKNGRMSLEPALPYRSSDGVIDASQPVTISGMFTEGNIIEDSLEINWLELEERKLFQSSILYTRSRVNQFPEQRTLVCRYTDVPNSSELPVEEFDFSHIHSTEHAKKVARYFLALRRYQTHTITFQTLPWGLSLEPGKLIRVASEMSPYRPENNGVINDDGGVISVIPLADGNYPVFFWNRQNAVIQEGTLEIKNGLATELFGTVFSVRGGSNEDSQIYQIEALDVNEDGIVTIKASNYAVDSSGRSLLALDTLGENNNFEFVGGDVD